MIYNITVRLEMNDFVEANSPEEAFEILSTDAMNGGSWHWYYEEIEEDDFDDYEDDFDEVGFNPYMGCYDYDY